MPDLDENLAALARYAGHTGRLDPAATIRARGDRRRRRRYVASAALGVALVGALGVGIAVAQPNLDPKPKPAPHPAASSAAPAPSPSFPEPPHKPIPNRTIRPTTKGPTVLLTEPGLTEAQAGLTYRHAYSFVPIVRGQEVTSSVMTVLSSGRVEITTDHGSAASFTTAALSPNGAGWLIRADQRGGSQCLAVRADGKVETKKCLPGPEQEVRYHEAGRDAQGRRAFAISFGGGALGLGPVKYLTWDPRSPDGLIVKTMPSAGPETTWVLVDLGRSTLAD
jgi:hypothetical protein